MLDTYLEADSSPQYRVPAPCIGQLVGVTPEGRPLVDFAENAGDALVARSTVRVPIDQLQRLPLEVLVVFENQDLARPIIVGILADTIVAQARTTEVLFEPDTNRKLLIDGERVTLTAKHELELRCGKSSITLRKDGRLLIKGVDLASRASGTQRIKGSSVAIN